MRVMERELELLLFSKKRCLFLSNAKLRNVSFQVKPGQC